MGLFVSELTKRLVDIPSVSGDEAAVGLAIFEILEALVLEYSETIPARNSFAKRIEVEPNRFNVYACFCEPVVVTLTTHMDTVPPFIPCTEDESHLYGRGVCDAKGIAASMICAVERLLSKGVRGIALLFVVGEERGSAGAIHAGKHPFASQYLINGEPTENRLGLGTKGALRLELEARGKMAHSAYPELGESAIDKLLDALEILRRTELPVDETLGPSTMNVGTIEGGRAPNVIPDHAKAEILIRLVDDAAPLVARIRDLVGHLVEVREVLMIPAWRLEALPGFSTTSVAYTTDIPAFGPSWGKPALLGPGTIHVAHTPDERIAKAELEEAVELYERLVLSFMNSVEVSA